MIESIFNTVEEWLNELWIVQQMEQLFLTNPLLYLLILMGISFLLAVIRQVVKYVIGILCSFRG